MADGELASSELVNVIDPDTRQVGSIPQHQLQDALSQGYEPATPDDVQKFLNEQKYGGVGQQAITALEGAGSAATFGGSTAIEEGLGVKPEDIRGRRETNPVSHMVGQGLGIAGSTLIPGGGAAGVLEAAGRGAEGLLGLGEATSALTKIGSAAVRNAAETALFQTGDEVSKMLSDDPNQTMETAAMNVGLSGLMGGGIGAGVGAINPLWNVTMGTRVGKVLDALQKKMGGVEGAALPDAVAEAVSKSGLDLPPEIQGAISQDPLLRQMAETLRQSDTTASGLEFQKTEQAFKRDASEALAGAFGKSSEGITPKAEMSEYEAGRTLGKSLAAEFEAQTAPLAERFEALKEKYKTVDLPQDQYGIEGVSKGTASTLTDKLGELVQNQGWAKLEDSAIMSKVNKVFKSLPRLEKLEDITKLITQVGNETADFTNPGLMRAGQQIKSILRDEEGRLTVKLLGQEGPELVAEHAALRDAWKQASDIKDSLKMRLKVGGGDSIGSFIKNLKESSEEGGEKILRKLTAKDADLLQVLSKNFPQTTEQLRTHMVDQLLGSSLVKTSAGTQEVNPIALFRALQKMPKEMRDFAVPAEAQARIQAVETLMKSLESNTHNFSNTARTVDKLWSSIPSSAVGLITALTTHNPLLGFLVAPLTKWMGKDVPDAVRLGLLKFLGSNQPMDAEGFKAMVDIIHHVQQADSLLNKSVKGIFKGGSYTLPESFLPSEKKKEKLSKKIDEAELNPAMMMNMGGKTAHYLPDHAQAAAQLTATALQYLKQNKPAEFRPSPLDTPIQPTKAEKQMFDRKLTIAEQPLAVFEHIKKGTLLPADVVTLRTIYPALYGRMVEKVTSAMTTSLTKDHTVPYPTRMSLSLFLGQPLDSTLTPAGIQASQMALMDAPAKNSEAMPQGSPKHSTASLSKTAPLFETASQARELKRMKP